MIPKNPFSEVGEILVKGTNVMLGYYKNESATQEVIDDEGWLHTGDLGVIDKNNFIFIKGRSKKYDIEWVWSKYISGGD